MKTITIELNDDVADRFLSMDKAKRLLAMKFITDLEKHSSWKELFLKTAEQAEKQGMTEEKLQDLLKDE